jgi:RNA polymerase sigma-70 factor (ECF subfamily)
MARTTPDQITKLLMQWSDGQQDAQERLFEALSQHLRALARQCLRPERPNHTLQTTALIHEAYLRLVNSKEARYQDRAHFFAMAAKIMRHILTDYARRRQRSKRGGGVEMLPLNEALVFSPERSADLIALDQALTKLQAVDRRKVQVIELRLFGGLSLDEIAAAIGVSSNTVIRDWRFALAWLRREITGQVQESE